MTASSSRLRRVLDFRRLYQSGRKYTTPHLRFLWALSRAQQHRWGIVVSVKISKRATRRNRLRRILRAQVDRWGKDHKTLPPIDAVIIVRRYPEKPAILIHELHQCLATLFPNKNPCQLAKKS